MKWFHPLVVCRRWLSAVYCRAEALHDLGADEPWGDLPAGLASQSPELGMSTESSVVGANVPPV